MEVTVTESSIRVKIDIKEYVKEVNKGISKIYILSNTGSSNLLRTYYESNYFPAIMIKFYAVETAIILVYDADLMVRAVFLSVNREVDLQELTFAEEVEKIIVPYVLEGYYIRALGWKDASRGQQ